MNRRLSIRLPPGLALGIEALARRTGRTKSEIVRDALTRAGVRVPQSRESRAEVRRRAARFRKQQSEAIGGTTVRESRDDRERQGQPDAPAQKRRACRGNRPTAGSRVTAGFQETQPG